MQVLDRANIRLRVWERGAGETLACGTGACAAVVAGRRRGLLDAGVKVATRGGALAIALGRSGPARVDDRTCGDRVRGALAGSGRLKRRRATPERRVTTEQDQREPDGSPRRRAVPQGPPAVLRGLRGRDRGDLRPASARRARDSRSPSGRSSRCATRMPSSPASSPNWSASAARTTPPPSGCTGRRSRCSPPRPRDDAGRALPQPARGLRACRTSPCGCGAACPNSPTCRSSRRRRLEVREYAERLDAPATRAEAVVGVRATGSKARTPRVVRVPAAAHRGRRSGCWRSRAPIRSAFTPGSGTIYLSRLAELASVAIARYLPRDVSRPRREPRDTRARSCPRPRPTRRSSPPSNARSPVAPRGRRAAAYVRDVGMLAARAR